MPARLPEEMQALYETSRAAILQRLVDFSAVPPEEYFYELCYCLLTPQSSARNVSRAVEELQSRDFFNAPFDAAPVLRTPQHYVRFHLTKAKRLLKAREQFNETAAVVLSLDSAVSKRSWLVEHVNGLSLKEASHFLRNIGERDLAIIDRHILTHLVACGVLKKKPASISTKRYLAIENKFKKFSKEVGIAMDELDLLFWSSETGEILK